MADGVNKVILIGNLGADPEARFTGAGKAVTSVWLATSESWKNKQTSSVETVSYTHLTLPTICSV